MRRVLLLLIFSLFFVGSAQAADSPCSSSDSPMIQNMMKRVGKAVALIEAKGADALAEIQQKVEPWYDDDGYVFIHDITGKLVSNPAYPEMVGREMIDFRDVAGKPIVRFMLEQAEKPSHSGWVHYLWPRHGEIGQSWKSTFVKLAVAPNKDKYIVAIGYNNVPTQPCFAVQQVDDAVRLLDREGLSAFPYIRSRVSPFIWKSSYIFVFGMDGMSYINPAQPELEGANVDHLTDGSGEMLVKQMKAIPFSKSGEWVQYTWPKPGEVTPVAKRTYVRKVRINGAEYVVGGGIYE